MTSDQRWWARKGWYNICAKLIGGCFSSADFPTNAIRHQQSLLIYCTVRNGKMEKKITQGYYILYCTYIWKMEKKITQGYLIFFYFPILYKIACLITLESGKYTMFILYNSIWIFRVASRNLCYNWFFWLISWTSPYSLMSWLCKMISWLIYVARCGP